MIVNYHQLNNVVVNFFLPLQQTFIFNEFIPQIFQQAQNPDILHGIMQEQKYVNQKVSIIQTVSTKEMTIESQAELQGHQSSFNKFISALLSNFVTLPGRDAQCH